MKDSLENHLVVPEQEETARPLLSSSKFVPSYTLEYVGGLDITLDGSSSEWNDIESQNFYDFTNYEMTPSYFKAVQTGKKVCVFFHVFDNTEGGGSDMISFRGDFGTYQLSRDGGGNIPDYGIIDNMFIGWSGEFCIPYDDVNIWVGNEDCLKEISLLVINNQEEYLQWPKAKDKGTGKFCSPEGWSECLVDTQCQDDQICDNGVCQELLCSYPHVVWEHSCVLPEGYCIVHEDCEYDEFCIGASYESQQCVALDCNPYQIAQDHECVLQTGACYDDSDCDPGESCEDSWCVYEGCVVGGATECCSNSDCGEDEYCNDNEACEDVPEGNCGYADNHVWNEYECCSNSDCNNDEECVQNSCVGIGCTSDKDCENDEYCNDNEACEDVPEGNCRYADNHVWNEYECCSNSDCNNDEECVQNSCVGEGDTIIIPSECEGIINLQLVELMGSEEIMAVVSGIDNCEGKIVTIRENDCNGNFVCSFESEDEGGDCEFNAPTEGGFYLYFACADLDDDGTDEFDQEGYLVEEEIDEICVSTGCAISDWSDCICEDGEEMGVVIGNCEDNCGNQLTFEQGCICEVEQPPQPTQEQLVAEQAIEEAENAIDWAEEGGIDVLLAEEKLDLAQEAYDSGNYGLAVETAEEVVVLLDEEEDRPFWDQLDAMTCGTLLLLGLLTTTVIYYWSNRPKPIEKPIRKNKGDNLESKLEKLEEDIEKEN